MCVGTHMCPCMCVWVHMCANVCVWVHTSARVHVCGCTRVPVYVYRGAHVCPCMCGGVHTQRAKERLPGAVFLPSAVGSEDGTQVIRSVQQTLLADESSLWLF